MSDGEWMAFLVGLILGSVIYTLLVLLIAIVMWGRGKDYEAGHAAGMADQRLNDNAERWAVTDTGSEQQ